MANNYYERGDRLNVHLAAELPEEMTGTQDTRRICGMCKHYCQEVIGAAGNFCSRTGASEIGFFARKNCFEERMNDGKDK